MWRASTGHACVASFAAFIAVCAVLPAIPVGALPVPITLQTFGVAVTGAVLEVGEGRVVHEGLLDGRAAASCGPSPLSSGPESFTRRSGFPLR